MLNCPQSSETDLQQNRNEKQSFFLSTCKKKAHMEEIIITSHLILVVPLWRLSEGKKRNTVLVMNLPPVYSTFFESTIDIKNSPVSVEYLFWSHRKNLFLFVWNMYTCEIRDTNFKVLT